MQALLLELPAPVLENPLHLAARIPIYPQVQLFPPEEANRALQLLKAGQIDGAGVLVVNP